MPLTCTRNFFFAGVAYEWCAPEETLLSFLPQGVDSVRARGDPRGVGPHRGLLSGESPGKRSEPPGRGDKRSPASVQRSCVWLASTSRTWSSRLTLGIYPTWLLPPRFRVARGARSPTSPHAPTPYPHPRHRCDVTGRRSPSCPNGSPTPYDYDLTGSTLPSSFPPLPS